MPKTTIVATRGSASQNINTTNYGGFSAGFHKLANETNESLRQTVIRTAGTFSRMWARLSANDRGATWRFRKNGANGTATISAAAGVTQHVSATGQDTVAPGDKIGFQLVTNNLGTTFVDRVMGITFENADPAITTSVLSSGSGPHNLSVGSTTEYVPIAGDSTAGSTVLAQAQFKMPQAATMRAACITVGSNGRTTHTTFRSNINGVNGSLLAIVPPGAAGTYEDAVNLDVLAQGDLVCFSAATGTGTGTLPLYAAKVEIDSTTRHGFIGIGNSLVSSIPINAGVTRWIGLGGGFNANALVEADVQSWCGLDAGTVLSRASIYVGANTAINGATVTLYKNGAPTAIVIAIAANTPGRYENLVGTATVDDPTDQFYWALTCAAGGGSIVPGTLSLGYQVYSAPASAASPFQRRRRRGWTPTA